MINLEGETNTIIGLCERAIMEEDMRKFFEFCYVIFRVKKKTELVDKVKAYLSDVELMRDFELASSLKGDGENRINYFSDDKGADDPFLFLSGVEAKISSIRMDLLTGVSDVVEEEEAGVIDI